MFALFCSECLYSQIECVAFQGNWQWLHVRNTCHMRHVPHSQNCTAAMSASAIVSISVHSYCSYQSCQLPTAAVMTECGVCQLKGKLCPKFVFVPCRGAAIGSSRVAREYHCSSSTVPTTGADDMTNTVLVAHSRQVPVK